MPFNIPLLTFLPKIPAEGVPMLGDWTAVAMSVWGCGYEAFREPFEMKPARPDLMGKPLELACLEAVKGCGRMSILLYTVFRTFLELKNSLDDADKADLKRPLANKGSGIKPSSFRIPTWTIPKGDGGVAIVVLGVKAP